MPISEVYNIDCVEYMKTIQDKFFDLAIIDPPYGIKAIHKNGKVGWDNCVKAKRYHFTEQTDRIAPNVNYFNELFRVSKFQVIFGANHFISKIPHDSSCWIVWDKLNGDSDFADCELAWTNFKTATRIFRFRWCGMLQENMKNKEIRIHPYQKPVALYKWILINFAKPNWKIFDSHLGSGSSRIACYELNFDFWGCEIDKIYFQDMENRFNEHAKQLKLL